MAPRLSPGPGGAGGGPQVQASSRASAAGAILLGIVLISLHLPLWDIGGKASEFREDLVGRNGGLPVAF